MGVVNLPPNLYSMFQDIQGRLTKLENAGRFTMPNVSSDLTSGRNGDIWLNTTSNTPKYLDNTGAVATFGAAGSPFGPRVLKAGYFYGPIGLVTQGSAVTFTADRLYATPFYCSTSITAIRLAINVGALNGASGGVRVGIYSNSTTDDYPNARLADAGVIPTDTVLGNVGPNIATISVALTPGLYWLVAVRQGVSNPNLYGFSITNGVLSEVIPTGTISSTSYGAVAWSQAGVTGALPATFTTTKTLELTAPAVSIGF